MADYETHTEPGGDLSAASSTTRGKPLVCAFQLDTYVAVRHEVRRYAGSVGLEDLRLYNFVVAVSEIMTNAIQHGGGAGDLRVWSDDGRLYCEITDRGPGMPGGRVNGFHLPAPGVLRGRGLWLARQICEQVDITTDHSGTRVLLRFPLAPGREV